MGEIAEYYIHQQIHEQPYIKKDIYVWKTREGKKIPINELSNNHLKNIYNHLNKNVEETKNWLKIIQDEMNKRNLINHDTKRN